MSDDEKWIRLQVRGGTEFNFILPANPSWKVSTLADHMIKVYNEVTSHEISSLRAEKVGSLKRNGFYVAPSLKVGNVFNDWDEVSCNIVLKKIDDDQNPKPSKSDIKIQKESKPQEEKSEKPLKLSEPKVESKKEEKKPQVKTNEKKNEESKQQKGDESKSSDIMNMLELVRGSNKIDKNEKKPTTEKAKLKEEDNKKKQGNEAKKVAIIVEEESD